ncbi:hypothetical protein OH77DRAFT_584659 [Trametes cingulata]|nr:hypothetical protein OH77DRAFT_584659 [Trametes cingulata]
MYPWVERQKEHSDGPSGTDHLSAMRTYLVATLPSHTERHEGDVNVGQMPSALACPISVGNPGARRGTPDPPPMDSGPATRDPTWTRQEGPSTYAPLPPVIAAEAFAGARTYSKVQRPTGHSLKARRSDALTL